MAIGSHQSAKAQTDEWLTPPEILKDLGPFDLDPAAPIPSRRPWPMAKQHYDVTMDGLSLPWHGFVWCNPPYGQKTKFFLEKMAEHRNGIALTFARTETKMFYEHVWPAADAVFFFHGRLHFYYVNGTRAKGNCGGPSMLIAYGQQAVQRLQNSTLDGTFVHAWRK